MLFKNVSYTKNAESGHAVPIQTKISNKWSKQNEPSEEEATKVEVSGCLIKMKQTMLLSFESLAMNASERLIMN